MRSCLLFVALLIAFACTSCTAGNGTGNALKQIDGNYTVTELIVGGKTDPRAGETKSFIIQDGKIVIERGGVERVMTFTLDSSKKPPHIDMTYQSDNKTSKGIYRLKENGKEIELVLAFPEDVENDARPTNFEGKKGILIKLTRAK